MNNIVNYLLDLFLSLHNYLAGYFDNLHLSGLPRLFWDNLCGYFDNAKHLLDGVEIDLNRHFNGHVFRDYLLHLNYFYNLFLYFLDHWFLDFFNHFPHNFLLDLNWFFDESIDVDRDFFVHLLYYFFFNINRHLLLNNSIPLDEYWPIYLFNLFYNNLLLDLDSHLTNYLYFDFDRHFLHDFYYLLLFHRDLLDYLNRNLLLDFFNDLLVDIDYPFNLNRHHFLYYHLSYHLDLFDDLYLF